MLLVYVTISEVPKIAHTSRRPNLAHLVTGKGANQVWIICGRNQWR